MIWLLLHLLADLLSARGRMLQTFKEARLTRIYEPGPYTQTAAGTFGERSNTDCLISNGLPIEEAYNVNHSDRDRRSIIGNDNAAIASSPVQVFGMEAPSSLSYSLSEGILPSPLSYHDQSPGENGNFSQYLTRRYLENLDPSVLKQLSKDVSEALILSVQRKQENLPQHERNKSPEVHGSGTTGDRLRCEYPECNGTFRHNKDRLRHARHFHLADAEKFVCPVVDCTLGFRHTYTRADSLRAHLTGKKISALQWSCFLPGCSEIAANRACLRDHIQRHDFASRSICIGLLITFGFAADDDDYLVAKYTCNIPGCPYGTLYEEAMSEHLSIPHDGPFCPCPIPGCREVSEDLKSAKMHLCAAHDCDTRHRFEDEVRRQNLIGCGYYFACPVCPDKLIIYGGAIESHCENHGLEELLKVSEALLTAWKFAFGPKYAVHIGGKLWCQPNIDGLIAYLTLPQEDRAKLDTQALLEEAGARLRASVEVQNISKRS